MFLKKILLDYFGFGKRDRIGIIAFVVLIIVIYLLPNLSAKTNDASLLKENNILVKTMDTLAAKKQVYSSKKDEEKTNDYQFEVTQTKNFKEGELFRFDPNTLSIQGWQRLGLSEKTGKTIDKYRSKGGKFYRAQDIKKIWGIPEGFYERVKDYIVLSSIQSNYSQNNVEKPYTKPERKVLTVNINEADTASFVELPGIGSKLAARIINFRDKLGGFYSVEQVGETYGLPDSTYQKIKGLLQLSGSLKKLNVNTSTKDELKVHPYIKWNLANAIVEYRNQHGNFKSLEELKNIALIDEATFNKIVHYLEL